MSFLDDISPFKNGVYHSKAAANRAVARLAAYMTSHPDAAPKDCPRHIRANAAQAMSELRTRVF